MNNVVSTSTAFVPPPFEPPVMAGSGGGDGGVVVEYKLGYDPTKPIENVIVIHYGAKVLGLKNNRGILTLFAWVNRNNPLRRRNFIVLPTDIEYYRQLGVYYGSVDMFGIDYHVFER